MDDVHLRASEVKRPIPSRQKNTVQTPHNALPLPLPCLPLSSFSFPFHCLPSFPYFSVCPVPSFPFPTFTVSFLLFHFHSPTFPSFLSPFSLFPLLSPSLPLSSLPPLPPATLEVTWIIFVYSKVRMARKGWLAGSCFLIFPPSSSSSSAS